MFYYRIYPKIRGRTPHEFGQAAGRWNLKGIPLIYLSSSVSLVVAELLSIHGNTVRGVPYEVVKFEIDESFDSLDIDTLFPSWDSNRPFNPKTQKKGSDWAVSKKEFGPIVPSARIPISEYPLEHNLIINPHYPNYLPSSKL